MRKYCVFVLLLAIMAAGCLENTEKTHLQKKIDPIAENMLDGIAEKNYTKFSDNFTMLARKALPEPKFYEFDFLILSSVGAPVSKEFVEASEGERYTTAIYRVTFENGSEGLVIIALIEENGELKVTGVWIDSPTIKARMEAERRELPPP
jgi:hypothetical protein